MFCVIALASPATSGAEQVGYWCGGIVIPLLAVAGILKCVQIMRRPTTHTPCVLSLMLFLGMLLLAAIWGNWVRHLPWASNPAVVLLGGSLLVGGALAGLILGIVGLIDYSQRAALFRQGRHQAVWGIILNGLGLLAIAGMAAAKGFSAGRSSPPPVAADWKATPVAFPDLNFRVQHPGPAWTKVDAGRLNPDANVVLARKNPEVFFMVIAEQIGAEKRVSPESLVDIVQSGMRARASSAEFGEVASESLGGIEGRQFTGRASLSGLDFTYSFWVASHNGYNYQLLTWGQTRDAARVHLEAPRLKSGFEVIDPARVYRGSAKPAGNVEAPQFGYAVEFEGSGWSEWDTLEEDYPDAHSGAGFGLTHHFAIVPLRLDGLAPTLEELAATLLRTINMEYPGDEFQCGSPESDGHTSRLQIETEQTLDDYVYRFRMRVVQTPRFAYLLSGWCLKGDHVPAEELDKVMARVRFLDGPPPGAALTPREQQVQGRLLVDLGMTAFQAFDFEKALPYLQAAHTYVPQDADVLNRVADTLHHLRRRHEAVFLLRQNLPGLTDSREARANLACNLLWLNQEEEALALYTQVFDEDYDDPYYFEQYISSLEHFERFDDAHRAIDRRLQEDPSADLQIRKASVYSEQEKHEAAVALLADVLAANADDAEIAMQIAYAHLAADRVLEARDIAQRLIDRGATPAESFLLKGDCEYRLKRYPEARACCEQVLRHDSANQDAKLELEELSAMLTEDDAYSIRDSLEPVAIPPAIVAQATSPGEAGIAAPDQAGSRCESWITGIEYLPGERYQRTEYRRYAILNRRGVGHLATLSFSFDPLVEQIYVNWVRVHDGQGTLVGEGAIETAYVVDENPWDETPHERVLHVPVPALAPGCTIDVAVTARRTDPPGHWPFLRQSFSPDMSVARRALFVRGAVDTLATEADDRLERIADADWIGWVMHHPPTNPYEPLQPYPDQWLPMLVIAERQDTWEAPAREYLETLEDRLVLDDAARDLAKRLTQGLTDSEAIIEALAAHVQTEYEYGGARFSERAMIPNRVPDILAGKHGDSKDHALLLCQLLHAAGQPAALALVNTSATVRPNLPSLGQFDHMVVWTPDRDGNRFLDTTMKYGSVLTSSRDPLRGGYALVLDPAAPRLVASPPCPPEPAAVITRRDVKLINEHDLEVAETVTLRGECAQSDRWFLQHAEADGYHTVLAPRFASHGVSGVETAEIDGLNEPDQPLVIRMRYRVNRAFRQVGSEWNGRVPMLWERLYVETESVPDRRTPFEIRMPIVVESQINLTLPEGVEPGDLEALGSEGDLSFFTWSVRATGSGRTVTIECRARRECGQFPAEQYGAYAEASSMFLEHALEHLTLRPTGDKSGPGSDVN